MAVIVEISENGTLQIPEEILRAIQPNIRFRVEVGDENRLILSPVSSEQPFWATATP